MKIRAMLEEAEGASTGRSGREKEFVADVGYA